jgi:hypothetical protein
MSAGAQWQLVDGRASRARDHGDLPGQATMPDVSLLDQRGPAPPRAP